MAIVCQKCRYEISQTQAITYLILHYGSSFQDVILPAIQASYAKRNMQQWLHETLEDIFIASLNHVQTPCAKCTALGRWGNLDIKIIGGIVVELPPKLKDL